MEALLYLLLARGMVGILMREAVIHAARSNYGALSPLSGC
jgi:hypothetical protein